MIQYFIKKTVVTWCLNVGIILLGLFSLSEIANEFIPAIEIPAVAVVFPTTVNSSEKVIHDLVEPVERKLLISGQVEHVETMVESGRSILFIYYSWSLKPEDALQHARHTVSSIERPLGVLAPIFVLHRPTMAPILRVAFHGESVKTLTGIVQDTARQLERTEGISEIRLQGATPKIGLVLPDAKKLSARKVSLANLFASASELWAFRHLFNLKNSPGQGASGSSQSTLLSFNLSSIEDLQQLPILGIRDNPVALRWVAKVQEGFENPKVFIGDGKPALVLELIKAPGADALSIVDEAQKSIQNLLRAHPSVKTTVIYDEAEKIRQAQSGVLSNFASGIFLNSLILIFFLGSISGCVIASCVFPTAIFGTLVIMKWLDISFNIFSLNGFSLAAGMITDSSTVVLEAIMRRKQLGEETDAACWKGTKDVATGVFTGALASSAVMLPICLQSGVSSKLFSDLAITMISGNFLCLIGVFTLVPWMSAKILGVKQRKPLPPVAFAFSVSGLLVKKVSGFAKYCFLRSLESRKFSVGIPVAVSALAIGSLLLIPPSELLPTVKSKVYSITIPVKRNVLDARGEKLVERVTASLGQEEDLEWVLTTAETDVLSATFQTRSFSPIDSILERLSKSLNIPLRRIISYPLGPTPPTEPMNYSGYFYFNKKLTVQQRKSLFDSFCKGPGVMDCLGQDHYSEPAVILKNLPLNMLRASLTPLHTAIEGSSHLQKLDLTGLANLPLAQTVFVQHEQGSSEGKMLPTSLPLVSGDQILQVTSLGSLYQTRFSTNTSSHFRSDLNDYDPLYFRLSGITIGEAVSLMEELKEKQGIASSSVKGMGGIQNMQETFGKMTLALSIAAILNILILLAQFKSFIQTMIIMFSIPLAVGGAVLGLVSFGETLNAGVIVGFVLLIGIVVNNGILLLESMNQEIESEKSMADALIIAIQSRTRPILMTACGTIFGMLPTLLLESEGQELYRGMAIVNIFGMAFGSFLTLVVTPVLTHGLLQMRVKKG